MDGRLHFRHQGLGDQCLGCRFVICIQVWIKKLRSPAVFNRVLESVCTCKMCQRATGRHIKWNYKGSSSLLWQQQPQDSQSSIRVTVRLDDPVLPVDIPTDPHWWSVLNSTLLMQFRLFHVEAGRLLEFRNLINCRWKLFFWQRSEFLLTFRHFFSFSDTLTSCF